MNDSFNTTTRRTEIDIEDSFNETDTTRSRHRGLVQRGQLGRQLDQHRETSTSRTRSRRTTTSSTRSTTTSSWRTRSRRTTTPSTRSTTTSSSTTRSQRQQRGRRLVRRQRRGRRRRGGLVPGERQLQPPRSRTRSTTTTSRPAPATRPTSTSRSRTSPCNPSHTPARPGTDPPCRAVPACVLLELGSAAKGERIDVTTRRTRRPGDRPCEHRGPRRPPSAARADEGAAARSERPGDRRRRVQAGQEPAGQRAGQRSVCPVDDDIATAVPTSVRYGERPAAFVLSQRSSPDDRDRRHGRTHRGRRARARRLRLGAGDARRDQRGHRRRGRSSRASCCRAGSRSSTRPGVGGLPPRTHRRRSRRCRRRTPCCSCRTPPRSTPSPRSSSSATRCASRRTSRAC